MCVCTNVLAAFAHSSISGEKRAVCFEEQLCLAVLLDHTNGDRERGTNYCAAKCVWRVRLLSRDKLY